MGAVIPQIVTETKASGAQVIDGSLSFNNENKPFLKRNFATGNRTTWTWSAWVRFGSSTLHTFAPLFNNRDPYDSNTNFLHLSYNTSTNKLTGGMYDASLFTSNRVFRDFENFYHIVFVMDSGNSKFELYVNGELDTSASASGNYGINSNVEHLIARYGRYHSGAGSEDYYWDGSMSQVYFIDGQALGPENFGFTDLLTNTWRPKKYTGTFTGKNSFYLPMDGKSPIGEDRSGVVTPNNGTVWSDSLTSSSGFRGSEPTTNAFDGDTSSICSAVNDGTITFTSPVTFASDSTIRVVVHGGDHTVTVNGGADQTISAGSLQTVTYSNSGNATFVMTFKRDASADTGVRAIEINGYILTDGLKGNSWTPVNFGGSLELDNPNVSGARPILNVTQGGTQAGVGVFGSKQNVGYAVTYHDDGGGNKYYIDGVKQATLTGLIRGATYTFDTVALGSTHPFRLSATSAHGTEYTNGVVAVTGTATTITIPYDAPETLYYYCTAHSGMGASITGITTNEKLADQYASNCVLALPLVGNANDVSNLINSGTTEKVMSVVNDAAASSDTSNFYSGSFEFDGTDDGITTPTDSDFDFGSGDFTIECWAKQDSTSNYRVFVAKYGGSTDREFYMGQNGASPVFINSDGTTFTATNFTASTNDWYHMAVCREGSATNMYINGVCEATGAAADQSARSNKVTIGFEDDEESSSFDGYLQDVRIYKGVAKYSGTSVGTQCFVVPSTSPDILPDTPSGVSGGSKLTKITDGAVSFDGTGDYLSISQSDDFNLLDDGTFTIEFFLYVRALNGGDPSYADYFGVFDGGSTGLLIYQIGSNLDVYINSGQRCTTTHPGTNKWHHIAVTRDGTTLRLFVDGISKSTSTASLGSDYSGALHIGGDPSRNDLDGFISNVRVIKGTALYTSNFTPPTEPLTNVTNTKLLCCQETKGGGGAAVSPTQSGFDTSASWSSTAIQNNPDDDRPIQHLFDGTTSNLIAAPSGNNATNRIDLGRSITATTSLRFYLNAGGYNNGKVTVFNGGTEVGSVTAESSQSSGFYSLDAGSFPLTFTAIQVSRSSDGYGSGMSQIEVDSSILKDPLARFGNAAATNFNPFNTDINTVRGQETGYATLNPIWKNINSSNNGGTFADGNLKHTTVGSNGNTPSCANIYASSGKFYWEVTLTSGSAFSIGVASDIFSSSDYPGYGTGADNGQVSWGYNQNGEKIHNSTSTSSYGSSYTLGDTIGVAMNLDNGELEYYKNGISQGVAFTDLEGNLTACHADTGSGAGFSYNFGQKPFKFPPPDGFQPLNTANIRPETVIARPDQYVGVTTYTGNAATLANTAIDTSTAYRYHRILFEGDTAGGSVSEIEFYDANGDKIDASDTNNAGNSINSNATQGLDHWTAFNGTRGGSDYSQGVRKDAGVGSAGFFISKDWGSGNTKIIYGVKVWGVNSYGLAGNTAGRYMKLQGSSNNSDWTDLQTWNEARYGTSWTTSSSTEVGHISDQTNFITTLNFNSNPDFVWIKNYSDSTGYHHGLFDTVRGPNKVLSSSNADNEVDATQQLMSFDLNGFTLGNNSDSQNYVNLAADGYVAWCWKAGGNPGISTTAFWKDGQEYASAAAAGMNGGSITPIGASVGTKQGFSIITYRANLTQGATISHGLTQKPDFAIFKNRDSTLGDGDVDWGVYHTVVGATKRLELNQNAAEEAFPGPFNNTEPTSSVFTFGGQPDAFGHSYLTNGPSGDRFVGYIWHNVPGLQKFGTYEGNGDDDGPFVELGFRPAVLILKCIDNSGDDYNWRLIDSTREPFNDGSGSKYVAPNKADSQADNSPIDFLSNGFKIRKDTNEINLNSHTFIYAAWAEAPTINMYGGQSNAR